MKKGMSERWIFQILPPHQGIDKDSNHGNTDQHQPSVVKPEKLFLFIKPDNYEFKLMSNYFSPYC